MQTRKNKKSGASGYQEITLRNNLKDINLLEKEFYELLDTDSIKKDIQRRYRNILHTL